MTSLQAIAAVGIRLWAASAFSYGIYEISFLAAALVERAMGHGSLDDADAATFMVFANGAVLIVAIVAWIFARHLVSWFVRPAETATITGSVSSIDIVGIGTFLIALSFVIHRLPSAVVRTASLVYAWNKSELSIFRALNSTATLAIDWLVSLLALLVMLRPYAVGVWFNNLRGAALACAKRSGHEQ